jgi:hypothetical protein
VLLFFDVVGVHAQQHGQVTLSGQFRGGRGGDGHYDLRARLGSWARHDVDFRETKLWPGGGDAGIDQRGEQQVQGLGKAMLMAVSAGAEYLQVDPWATPADTEVETAAGELVEQCALARGRVRAAGASVRP